METITQWLGSGFKSEIQQSLGKSFKETCNHESSEVCVGDSFGEMADSTVLSDLAVQPRD